VTSIIAAYTNPRMVFSHRLKLGRRTSGKNTMTGELTYYNFLGVIEVIPAILIVWFAWKRPRLNAT